MNKQHTIYILEKAKKETNTEKKNLLISLAKNMISADLVSDGLKKSGIKIK